jgi:STE24 endopeptidase
MTRLVLMLLLASGIGLSSPNAPHVPAAAVASPHFNARTATEAWLASVPAADRTRSDDYFEGGYWLLLWDFLYLVAVMVVLLQSGISLRMRAVAELLANNRWLQAYIYWVQFSVVTALLLLPLTIYEDFLREHRYGLSNQTFVAWLRDASLAFALSVLLGGLAVATIFALAYRLPRSWHIWGAIVAISFGIFGIAIAPVFIAPLFNRYTTLENSVLKRQILSLAYANGIPVDNVYEIDASKQSRRVSANVSGLFGTDRITLNDNLLARCSPQAVLAVMGHEMGHYVMHHILSSVMFMAIMLVAIFSALRWALTRSLKVWGARWALRGVSDLAVLPLVMIILSTISFVLTPLENTYIRTQEYEADIYGLNAARQPDGEAEVDLLLGEYRKLDPTPLEEYIFFDHPSGRTRIYAAMRWKAENLCLSDPGLQCANAPESIFRSAPTVPSDRSVAPLR